MMADGMAGPSVPSPSPSCLLILRCSADAVGAAVYLKLMEKSLKAEDFDAFFDAERDRLDRLLQCDPVFSRPPPSRLLC